MLPRIGIVGLVLAFLYAAAVSPSSGSWHGSIEYEGFVAQGPFMVTGLDATDTQIMCRSTMRATEQLSRIKLIFQNFAAGSTSPGDTGNGSAAAQTASIEYPSGTVLAQVTFGGSANGTIPNGGTLTSDYISLPTPIPNGAYFWVRSYQTNPNGFYYWHQNNPSLGDQCATAASGLTDQTMSGSTITGGTSQSWIQPPLAIIGYTINPSVLIIGDSRTAGGSAFIQSTIGNIAPPLVNANVPFVNIAVPNSAAFSWLEFATARDVLLPYGSQIIVALGGADMFPVDGNSRTAAQTIAAIQGIFAAAGARQKYLITIEPNTSSTDGWATTANQTNIAGPQRIIFNDAVRAGISGATGYYEIADVLESGRDSGLWAAGVTVYGQTGPFTTDGLHPAFPAGYAAETASGAVVAAHYP